MATRNMRKVDLHGFKGDVDNFMGITIEAKKQKFSGPEEFDENLTEAIPVWKTEGYRGLWMKIPTSLSTLIPVCVKHGFDFHHAKPGQTMMLKWLLEDKHCTVPEYANQYLGVAGFVVNNKNQLLVIQEKWSQTKYWKLPGGHADKGESIAETAKREVKEETGIDAEFVSVICFRHQHNYKYGCSDFYYICLMRPCDENQEPVACAHEIAECKWMDIEEYKNYASMTGLSLMLFAVQSYQDGLTNGNLAVVPTPILSYNKKNYHQVYSIQSMDK